MKSDARKKFILATMSAFFVVLALTIVFINVIGYRSVLRDADEILEVLSVDDFDFRQRMGKHRMRPGDNITPETPYESRYFAVTFTEDGEEVLRTDISRIVSVDREEAVELAQSVLSKNDRGTTGRMRYRKETENGVTTVMFLDISRSLQSSRRFLVSSIAISLICFLVVFALIAFFSNRIIRPITESYEKQKRFITDAGHEIRTPIAIISADADVIAAESGESEWVTDIKKQTEQLTGLMESLVSLARMDETKGAETFAPFSLSDCAKQAATSFYAMAMEQGKTLTCDVQDDLTLLGSEHDIRRLLTILLDNALKYSPSESDVRLTVKKENKMTTVSVYNRSVTPIPRENLSHLFDRFYRLDESRNSATGGYGIGLSLAKEIVSAHKGKISASTPDGQSLEVKAQFP